ncbi:MAG: diacylglycerol kinase family protein [Clostridiaceae bacterium]|jgi:diacylglycerol kinase|nr:diacylglycerol kinase family protein [Clostridiaceae bacterium]
MTKYKAKGFQNAFKNARKGMRLALKSERNIRIHVLSGVLVFAFGISLNLSIAKLCILLLTIAMVISSEMLNTAIEFSLDSIFHNRYSTLVGMAKDVSAGAVMLVSVVAVCVGLLIFVPAIFSYFS